MARWEQPIETIVIEISKIEIKEDDYLFIKLPDNLLREAMPSIVESIRKSFPDLRFLIYDFDVEFTVVHQEQEAKNGEDSSNH